MGLRAIVPGLVVVFVLLALTSCPTKKENPAQTAGVQPATQQAKPDPTPTPASAPQPKWVGDAMDFSFTTFAGENVRASSFAGKPLVLNFWASW